MSDVQINNWKCMYAEFDSVVYLAFVTCLIYTINQCMYDMVSKLLEISYKFLPDYWHLQMQYQYC